MCNCDLDPLVHFKEGINRFGSLVNVTTLLPTSANFFSLQPYMLLIIIVKPHQKGKLTPRRGEKVLDWLRSAESLGHGAEEQRGRLTDIFLCSLKISSTEEGAVKQ